MDLEVFTRPLPAPLITCGLTKFKARQTNAFFRRYRQSNVRQLLPASDYFRAHSNQLNRWAQLRQRHSARLVGRKPGGAAEHWLTVAKALFGWALNFRVPMLLKGAVSAMFFQFLGLQTRSWYNFRKPCSVTVCDTAPMATSPSTL